MCPGVPLVPLAVPCRDLFEKCGLRRDTTPKALTTQMAEFALRHVEPTAMLGGRMERSCIGDSFGLRGVKGFIQRGLGVGMQIVHHEADLLSMRSMLINKFLDKMRPIHFRSLIRDLCRPLAS